MDLEKKLIEIKEIYSRVGKESDLRKYGEWPKLVRLCFQIIQYHRLNKLKDSESYRGKDNG